MTGVVPVPGYYQRIREICDRYEVLFIVDEVLTGYGRTGRWLAIEHWGVEPDIVVMGKGISSGYVPLGAVLAAPRVVDAFTAGTGIFSHGFTYSGNPLCTFVGLQVLRYAQAAGCSRRWPPRARSCARCSGSWPPGTRSSVTSAAWACSPGWRSWLTGPAGSRSG